MTRRFLPYGERAVLIEVESTSEAVRLYEAVREADLSGVEDVLPAAVTVLVAFADAGAMRTALPALWEITPQKATHVDGDLVTIPVVYDGADLPDVAVLTGLSVDEVVAVHTGAEYSVAFNGFSPGFAYLVGLDPRLQVPRRPSPRTAVPAGSVAMTGRFTAVYPRRSPGGWQLLGRTETAMWDSARDQPSLLGPGMRVRFVAR